VRSLAPVVLATVAAAGCSGASGPGPAGTSAALVGIRFSGGPTSSRAQPLRAGRVRALRLSGTLAASARVVAGRRTRLELAPGRYRLTASSGDARCIPRELPVDRGTPVRVDVLCSVK
jgi:hypothetical protein